MVENDTTRASSLGRTIRAGVGALADVVLVVDERGDVVAADVSESVPDLDGTALVGGPWRTVCHPDDVQRVRAAVADLDGSDGRPWRPVTARLRGPEETWMPVEAIVTRSWQPDSVDGFALVARERPARHRRDTDRSRERLWNCVTGVLRDVAQLPARERFERLVCERLGSLDRYAAVGILEARGETVDVRAEAPPTEPMLERFATAETPDGRRLRDLVGGATSQRVRLEDTERASKHDDSATDERASASACFVPIAFEKTVYSSLVVVAERGRYLSGEEATLLETVAAVLGLAVYATKTEELLLSDDAIVLQFRTSDPDVPAVGLSTEFGCSFRLEGISPGPNDTLVLYVLLDGAPADSVRERLGTLDGVQEVSRVSSDADRTRLQLQVGPDCFVAQLLTAGLSVRELRAESGEGVLVVDAPVATAAKTVVEAVLDRAPEWSLVKKKRVGREPSVATPSDRSPLEALTEKQRSALRTAYLHGYFEYPRGNTAQEVAEALGISDSTFHQHLKAAQRKVFGALLGTEVEYSKHT